MKQEETINRDPFIRWMLGVTAAVVVSVGGWLGATLTNLNARFGVIEAELVHVRRSLDNITAETNRTRDELNVLRERLIKLEVDNTRVTR